MKNIRENRTRIGKAHMKINYSPALQEYSKAAQEEERWKEVRKEEEEVEKVKQKKKQKRKKHKKQKRRKKKKEKSKFFGFC